MLSFSIRGHSKLDLETSDLRVGVEVDLIQVNLHMKFENYRWKHLHFRTNVNVFLLGVMVTLTFDLVT